MFDCVEMVEKNQEIIQAKLEAMSREEKLEFWRTQTDKLRERQTQIIADRQRLLSDGASRS